MLDLDIATIISRAIILVIAFTAHEFAHAATADWFGDGTPRANGRLTLNPLVHLDPLGSLLILVTGFGWARPVPINPYALERRNPYAPMWVALAGPASNLLLAVLAAVPFQLGLITPFGPAGRIFPTLSQFMVEFIFLNLILLLFNLIPVFPLDGEKVLTYLLPPSSRGTLEQLRPYGPMILMLLIFVGPWLGLDILGLVIGRPVLALSSLLLG